MRHFNPTCNTAESGLEQQNSQVRLLIPKRLLLLYCEPLSPLGGLMSWPREAYSREALPLAWPLMYWFIY
jgi:hypothetical protein